MRGGGGGGAVKEKATSVLMLTNMVTMAELQDATVVAEIQEDTIDECNKFGAVVTCVIPTPASADPAATPEQAHLGKIFVAFVDEASAAAARVKLHGRKFDGKAVVASFFPPAALAKIDPSYSPPAEPAPAQDLQADAAGEGVGGSSQR